MSDTFDPYFKWLGIPKADQPPHAYRLLGIELFESDADVISNAADGRMAQIKSFQTGKFGAVSQKLLNEIAAAKVCLLKPEKKTEYDRRLKAHLQQKAAAVQQVQTRKPPIAQAVAAPPQEKAGLSFLDDYTSTAPARTTARTSTKVKKSSWLMPAVIVVAISAVAGGAVGFYFYAGRGDDKANHTQASLPADSHHAGQSGNSAATTKPAGSAEAGPKSKDAASAKTSGNGHKPVTMPSAAPPIPEVDLEQKSKPDTKPESPEAVETTPKPTPSKTLENTTPDETPNKEPEPVKKLPMPDQAQFQEMKGKVLKIFQKDFADAKTPQAKLALAAKLGAEADGSKGEPAERFTLWRMAADKAVEAGDVSAALDIVDKINAQFDGDTDAIKYELLVAGAARAASTPEGARNLCESAMKLANMAVGRDEFDVASRYAKLATGSLRRVTDPQFKRDVVAHEHEIERLKTRFSVVAKAMETLKTNPENAAANLAVGQWRCLAKGEWEKGLPYLVKGSRDDLAELAKQELAKPAAPAQQAVIGDGWWALAEKDRSDAKAAFRARALHWYKQASPGLSGLEKIRVDKQIETMAQTSGGDSRQAANPPKTSGPRGVAQKGNVALLSLGASVSGVENYPEKMINPADTRATSYGPTPCQFVITLDKVYQLQQIRFKLQDKTIAAYQILVSRDGNKFELLLDCRKEAAGWQNIPFAARPVKIIKLASNGPNANVCVDCLEAYCFPVDADGNQQPRRGGR